MIFDARLLTTMQICPRRFLLESEWEVLRWRPKPLFDALLRTGIYLITNGGVADRVADDMKARLFQNAANPGLDLPYGSNPYVVAKDYCSILDTILRVSASWSLPKLSDSPIVQLNSSVGWQPMAFSGEDGSLHRIVTIDRWTEDDLSRELHGWFCIGDIAATGMPMTIHVIEIGQQRKGRRASPWARAWRNPDIPNLKLRFARKDGSALKGWLPVYLANSRDIDPKDWVALMAKEGFTESLVHHIPVNTLAEGVREDTIGQMLQESARAGVLLSERHSTTWRALPMSRGACDSVVPCPWQHACYQDATPLEELGLYRIQGSAMLATA